MSRRRWWGPAVLTSMAHVAFLALPLQFTAGANAPEASVVLRFRLAEPPLEEPPPPQPPPPEPPPPEELPPEPEPVPQPRRVEPAPQSEPAPEPPPPEPSEPAPPPPVAPVAEPAPTPIQPPKRVEPPTVPQKARPEPGPTPADFRGYAMGMRSKFLRHRRYPPAALRTGLEGVTQVKLSVDRHGRLVGEPTIAHSSGHTVLDAEALRVVRVAAPFDPLPEHTPKDVMIFVIPIDFRIQAG